MEIATGARGQGSRAPVAWLEQEFQRWLGALAAVMAGALVRSCRFIPTADVQALGAGQSQAKAAFDPDKMVRLGVGR